MLSSANISAKSVKINIFHVHTLTKKSLATLAGEIADPEITVKLEMRDVIKVHDEQTSHLHHLIHRM